MTFPPANRLRRILAALFLFVMAYYIGVTIGVLAWLARGPDRVKSPFFTPVGSIKVLGVTPAALSAGMREGDELLAIDGRPYTGRVMWANELRRKHPGEVMTLLVRRSGTHSQQTISLPLESLGGLGPLAWPVLITIYVVTPFCALLLGFGVALIRPRDPMAWLLLILMLSLASFAETGEALRDTLRTWQPWPAGFRQAALFYHVTVDDLWPICLLLFGIYFGIRLPLDRRLPPLKWLFIVPIVAMAILDGAFHITDAAAMALYPFAAPMDSVQTYMSMAAIAAFFAAIWNKVYDPSNTPDVRRRLRLVGWGATAALTPLFLVVLWVVALHRSLSEEIIILCIVPLAIFPLTLAYVIVVQRALDVRVVVRQGLQYALAQRGVRIMQAFLTMFVIGVAVLAGSQYMRRPQKLTIVAFSALAIVLMDRGSGKLRGWIDRRFFREAHNTELILNELSETVRTMVESLPLLQTVAHQISHSLHVPHVGILVKHGSMYRTEYAVGYETPPLLALGENGGVAARLKRERTPERVYFDDPQSWIYRAEEVNEAEREVLRSLGTQLLLPLAYKDKLAGMVALGPKQSEEPYSATDIRLLESVATQTGLALENSRLTEAVATEAAQRERLNRDLEIAREVQERLFPQSCPPFDGLDYAGRCRPALGVGGDYYDWLELPNGGLGIAIGDVSGKGVPAALLMASLQASLRSQTLTGPTDLAALMSNMNRLIYEATPSNRYATFFYGQYHPSTRRFDYVNGGHNPPLVLRCREVLHLEEGGPVVGLFRPARYTQASVELQRGDVLVLFTDGISEAMNAAEEEWEEERLIGSVRRCRDCSAAGMIDVIIQDADAFVAGAPQHDDMTLMVVKVV